MNNFSISPLSSTNLWSQASTLAGSSIESPETKVDQLEREADEQAQHLPEAQRAAYRTMVRREIAQICMLITQMRAQGFKENAINGAIGGLTQKFYESKNRFLEGNEQFAINKARVCASNQATANKIRQCTPDFSPIARIPIDDDEDDMTDQSYSEPLLPRADESVQASFQGFLRDKAMERVVTARVTAATLNAIGYVVKESAAVVLGCRGSEEGKKSCQAVLGYVKTGAKKVEEVTKDVVTWMGAKPALKRMISGNAITQRLVELGIDPEKSDQWFHVSGQQYIEDCNTISLQAVFAGSMTGTFRLFRTVFPSGNIVGTHSGNFGRGERRLLSRQHEHQIESSTETSSIINGEGRIIATQKEYRTFLLPPQSTRTSATRQLPHYTASRGNLGINQVQTTSTPLVLGPNRFVLPADQIPIRFSPEIPQSPSIIRMISLFLRNESGTVKLPEFSKLIRERKFYVELFKGIGYDIVKGGKGSHTKMINRDYPKLPMAIIPKDRELTPGVARNLRRIYEKAIDIYQNVPPSKLGLPKQLKNFMRDEAGSVRNPFAGRQENPKLLQSQQVIQKIYETATRVPKGAREIPEYIDVQAVMDGPLVRHYEQSTGELLPRALMDDMREALSCSDISLKPPFYNENSGNTLITVLSADNTPIGVLKEFIATRSSTSGFIPEVVSLKLLERQELKYSSTPETLLVGKYTGQGFGTIKVLNGVEKGVVLYRFVPGETMADMLKNHRWEVPSVEYGRAVGEINRINFDLPVSKSYLEEKIATIQLMALHTLLDLQTQGFNTRFSLKGLETISQDVIRKPGLAGMTLGDAHHGNFIFHESPLNESLSTFKTTVIDTGSLMKSVNRASVPKGLPTLDFYQVISHFRMFEEFEAKNGCRLMSSSIDDFVQGYREIYRLPSTPEAERFSELFWEILTLSHYIETQAPKFMIESRIKDLDRHFAPPRVNGTTVMRTDTDHKLGLTV